MPEPRYPRRPPAPPPETVDPRWLLRALGMAIGGAIVLGYLALCLLVYLGGSPFLQPSPAVGGHPQTGYEAVRFDAASTGQPRLTGWWIPAAAADAHSPTLLLLHGGQGSLDQAAALAGLLHQVPANVLAFDYRGFGQSTRMHPSEQTMLEDAGAALDWLTGTQHLPIQSIVPVGVGLGGVIAAKLAAAHPELPAAIVLNPEPEALAAVLADPRTRLLPTRLLTRDRFNLAEALAAMAQPRLLIEGVTAEGAPTASVAPAQRDHAHAAETARLFLDSRDPKRTVTLSGDGPGAPAAIAAIRRFLDEYVTPVMPAAPATP